MKCLPVLFAVSLVVISIPVVSRADTLVPAGTLLSCTISDPNFSSKTADVGDPVLCYASPVAALGRTVLPYGTYLEGRFQDYRDPGHLVGKGWMELNFDRMVSGQDRVIPISAKVVGVPGYRVDKKGRIIGKGHAVRDTVEWMIPILWPEKILTLPLRGPRPVLKQETRMTLKMMDDTLIPSATSTRNTLSRAYPRQGFGPSGYAPSGYAPSSAPAYPVVPVARNANWTEPVRSVTVGTIPANPPANPPAAPVVAAAQPAARNLAMLIQKDGAVTIVSDYWLEGSARLRYVTADGAEGELPVEQLDLPMTVATNRRCGVTFTLRSVNRAQPR